MHDVLLREETSQAIRPLSHTRESEFFRARLALADPFTSTQALTTREISANRVAV